MGDHSIVGTTDTYFDGSPDDVWPTEEDVEYLIATANKTIPGAISRRDVISAYAGIRPLIQPLKKREKMKESDISRSHEIGETSSGLIFIAGGKYTTFREMAEETVNKLVRKLGMKVSKCQTKQEFLHESPNFYKIAKENGISEIIAERIVVDYGRKASEFLNFAKSIENCFDPIGSSDYLKADIHYAVKVELALHLSDIMMRRTQLFMRPGQGLDIIDEIVQEMGQILSWGSDIVNEEIESFKKDLGLIFNNESN